MKTPYFDVRSALSHYLLHSHAGFSTAPLTGILSNRAFGRPVLVLADILPGFPFILSLRLYLSLFSSLEYSEIRNSSSVATVEMLSTGQVTARAR